MSSYVELHCHSAYSLLDGAALPEALVARAAELGYPALALTDHDDLGGAVRFAQAAADAGIGGIIGAEITVTAAGDVVPSEARDLLVETPGQKQIPRSARDDRGSLHHLVLLAETLEGYGNLSTLITRARMDNPRGQPAVPLDLLASHAEGLFALTGCPRGWVPSLVAAGDLAGAREAAATLREIFHGRLAIECWDHGLAEEREMVDGLVAVARALGLPWVVTNDVHYVRARDRAIHDVLCGLRHRRPLDRMGTRLRPNGEWHLRSIAQLRRRWRHAPEGLAATLAVAERCAFRMDQLRPALPAFPLPPGVTADEYLERLVWQGAEERYGTRDAGSGIRGTPCHPGPQARDDRSPVPDPRSQLRHELSIIGKLGLAGYFLIVWDIVRFARREGILCQGRGSAANSAVCYCLGITAVDPIRLGLLFERFLSEERREAPDIDIDFAHRERERVLQYVYERYGREHAAMVCEQITYRGRSAVRDAARVLGFSVEQADRLAVLSDRFSARETARVLRGEDGSRLSALGSRPTARNGTASLDAPPRDAIAHALGQALVSGTEATALARAVKEEARNVTAEPRHPERSEGSALPMPDEKQIPRLRLGMTTPSPLDPRPSPLTAAGLDPADRRVRALAGIVDGLHQLPRHRSIHVGGFVLTAEPLSRVVPIEPAAMADRTVIQWEKDDLDPVGLIKIDLLGLGMLTLLQDCLMYIRRTRGVDVDLARLDMTDQAVYDDLCRADTIGVFQVESRAQMNTLPRLRPRKFYDLVVEVAIIRPGPIQGDMVHPYLRRRAGLEKVTYLHPSLEPILKRTLGIPLFQEQGMQVAVAAAGFTPGEADLLRRAMGHKRSHERMAAICERLIEGMTRNGIPEADALRIYNQINAFADYGFPESHAASFALLVYASAYLKHYYAPEFTAALLNAQPMGFYAPGTIIEDARRHGVKVRPVDVRHSAWDCTLENRDSGFGTRGSGTSSGRPERLVRVPSPESRVPAVPVVRLGLRLVRGLGAKARERYERALTDGGPFESIGDFVRRTGFDRRALRHIAEAGALDGFLPDEPDLRRRRAALWETLEAIRGDAGPLAPSAAPSPLDPRPSPLPAMSPAELTEADYRMTGISLNGHPISHLRPLLAPNGVSTCRDLTSRASLPRAQRGGERIAAAGLVICRQRPGTARGFVFLTLEDETGTINVVVTPKRFERQALLIARTPLLLVRGTLQVEQGVVNVRADHFRGLEANVGAEHAKGHDFR